MSIYVTGPFILLTVYTLVWAVIYGLFYFSLVHEPSKGCWAGPASRTPLTGPGKPVDKTIENISHQFDDVITFDFFCNFGFVILGIFMWWCHMGVSHKTSNIYLSPPLYITFGAFTAQRFVQMYLTILYRLSNQGRVCSGDFATK